MFRLGRYDEAETLPAARDEGAAGRRDRRAPGRGAVGEGRARARAGSLAVAAQDRRPTTRCCSRRCAASRADPRAGAAVRCVVAPRAARGVRCALLAIAAAARRSRPCRRRRSIDGRPARSTSPAAFPRGAAAKAVAANFAWSHAPGDDRFDVVDAARAGRRAAVAATRPACASSGRARRPSRIARLGRAHAGGVRRRDSRARDSSSWIQGAPSSGAAYAVERDASGPAARAAPAGLGDRVRVCRTMRRSCGPSRLVMRYPDSEPIEVRIVVDRWSRAPSCPRSAMDARVPARSSSRAPAKVNLFLHVTGRRADGYHTLESLFALVDLADTLDARRCATTARSCARTTSPASPPDDDLAVRAARALQRATGTPHGVDIDVDKRIPHGRGAGRRQLRRRERAARAQPPVAARAAARAAVPRSARRSARTCRSSSAGENAIARGIGERADAGHAARALARARVSARARADRGRLRGARIDTLDAVGENRRLFRELRTQRSCGRHRREIPGSRAKRSPRSPRGAAGAHDRLGRLRVRGVRDTNTMRAARWPRAAAAHRGPSRTHARTASARGASRGRFRNPGFRWGVAKW